MRAYLGLGTNMGARWLALNQAIDALEALATVRRVSPIYETAPVGGPPDQRDYLNCVVEAETDLSARELLVAGQHLEDIAGRVRLERNGPRPLDVDILTIDGVHIDEPDLCVPHPAMFERAFVLAPLSDLRPDLVPSDWRERLGGNAGIDQAVHRVGELVRASETRW